MNQNELQQTVWDAIIVGGGMVGASVALGLAQQEFKVLLLEKSEPDLNWSDDEPYQTRVSALTRASENILKALNAWPGIERRRLHAFTDMHVWEDNSDGEIHFSAKDLSESNLGFVVENSVIQAALWDRFADQPNLQVLTGQLLKDVRLEKSQAWVILENGIELQTRLVVGADGAFSKVRDLACIGLDTHDYEQCAVVGCVKTELSHEDTCWQRYRGDGPFAYLAMGENVSSIAWYLPTSKMQWALNLDDDQFALEVEKASGGKLGKVVEVNQRGAFPLTRRHAEHYVKPHLALVGDAAHTIHPQAGQGVNLGLLDAAALVETLVTARQSSEHWDRISVLRRYERWRRGDNVIVQRSMEGFDWLFDQQVPLKNQVRKLFLPIANQVSPIKNWLMGQALNGREPLPELAK